MENIRRGYWNAIQAIGTTKYVYILIGFSRHCFLFIWLCVIVLRTGKDAEKGVCLCYCGLFHRGGIIAVDFELLKMPFNSDFCMPAVAGYLVYTLLGYWIGHYELSKR